MSTVSTEYMGLSIAQQLLLWQIVSQGVRQLIREVPALDAAMTAARRRARDLDLGAQPRLEVVIEVRVVEYHPDQPSRIGVPAVEGGGA